MTPQQEYRARLNPHGRTLTDVIADRGTGIEREWLKAFRVQEWSSARCWTVLGLCGAGLAAVIYVAWRRG